MIGFALAGAVHVLLQPRVPAQLRELPERESPQAEAPVAGPPHLPLQQFIVSIVTALGEDARRRVVDDRDKAGLDLPQGRFGPLLVDEKADPPMWGRPVDVLVMKDGAVLVSDDYNGIVYRISYKK